MILQGNSRHIRGKFPYHRHFGKRNYRFQLFHSKRTETVNTIHEGRKMIPHLQKEEAKMC